MKKLFFLILAFVVIFAGDVSATTYYISGCRTINSPGYYVLTQDVDVSQLYYTACFNINSNDVILDGNGHTVRYTGNPLYFYYGIHGFSISTRSNITIKNMILDGWDVGIEFSDVYKLKIENVTIKNVDYGIKLLSSQNSTYINNTIENLKDSSIYITNSQNSYYIGNNIQNR